jgi:cytochrome c556
VKRILLASTLIALAVGFAAAQDDPIATREKTMSNMGKAWDGQLGKMTKGELPYDQKAVDATLAKVVAAAKLVPTLFPENSKTGEKTRALPAIWEHTDDVDARFKKLGEQAASYKGKITDLPTLKAAFEVIDKNCDDCHDKYRARKK